MDKTFKFTKALENKVAKTIKKFNLIKKGEKVLVACSGGKDSTSVLFILHKLGFKPEAITVDALIGNYTLENLDNLTNFCKQHKIPVHIISFRKEFGYSLCYIKSILRSKGYNWSSCTICGVLRRYLLNKYARKLNADKIATGHNINDEAQSVIMNLFKNNIDILAKLGPTTGVLRDSKFVPRIKPFYFISEDDIIRYSKINKFPVNYNLCPCRAGVYRCEIDELLSKYEKENPKVYTNIINWFLSISPLLKQKSKNINQSSQRYCKICKEPSKQEVCMACQILEKIR